MRMYPGLYIRVRVRVRVCVSEQDLIASTGPTKPNTGQDRML